MASSKGSKALSAEQIATVRAVAKRLIAERFDGNVKAAAASWGLAQATLNDLVTEKRGAGLKVASIIFEEAGQSLDVLIRGNPRRATAYGTVMGTWSSHTLAGVLEGWQGAAERARADNPDLPGWAIDAAAHMTAPPGARVATPEMAADLAMFVWQHASPEERERREAEARERGRARRRLGAEKTP